MISSSFNLSTFIEPKTDFILETDSFDPEISNVTSLSTGQTGPVLENHQPDSLNEQQNSSFGPLISNQVRFPANGTLNNNSSSNEFNQKAKLLAVNSNYKNHLYVYPKSLKYDMQKSFQKVRIKKK